MKDQPFLDTRFMEFQINKVIDLKGALLLKIAKQLLGRELVFETDIKRLGLITHELFPGREFIGFDGNMIGEIKMFHRDESDRVENNNIVIGREFEPKTAIK